LCVLTPDSWEILDAERTAVNAQIHRLDWEPADTDRGEGRPFQNVGPDAPAARVREPSHGAACRLELLLQRKVDL